MPNIHKSLALFAAGVAFSAAAIVACSDDSPGDADAAVCDCPAAEPPLSGRIINRTGDFMIPENGATVPSVDCRAGETVLGGGCQSSTPGLVLRGSGVDHTRNGSTCSWQNTTAAAITATVVAVCLAPAS